ncbi:probable indole-3-pyruvate monooxygenase YUCCA11 [Mercurialis annua]|uniref:probable indole-3-pyruvate monooxygenase YUCCA11 n=1 Tax=Mercurialis annua TaxID=3986 RepID=UPI00215E4A11|nr:probable indole-3-pyruvate monooxygenase YUCCA11 [Mercurialis annua]
MEEAMVVIVGAGPSGLAISACLNRLNIENIVLEREDCYASLWKKRTYDRVKLHIAKQFCELPYMSYSSNAPTFVPKKGFISYIDDYVSYFGIKPRYHSSVESVSYDGECKKWRIDVKNTFSNVNEVYYARFFIVATGENSEGVIPSVAGLDGFRGEYMHANQYVNARKFTGKDVLVVGCGNSGMEIAYDLSEFNARTSIVARSPVHVVSKEIVYIGMQLIKFLSVKVVDKILMKLCKLKDGDISKYGLQRPKEGPFHLKCTTGRSPTIDVGCLKKIKQGKVKVFPSISSISGNSVGFTNGDVTKFDAIIFATGYKSTVKYWLKDGESLFGDDGMPKRNLENKWKGENGLYAIGFGRNGLLAISRDAKNIAKDIKLILSHQN